MRGKSRNTRGSVMTNGAVGDVHCPGAVVENSGATGCVVTTKSAVGNVHRSRAGVENAPASATETVSSVTAKGAVDHVDCSGAGIENTASSKLGVVRLKRAIAHVDDPCSAVGDPTTAHRSHIVINDAGGDVKCPAAVVGNTGSDGVAGPVSQT